MNRSGEAIASVERAQQFDPLSLMIQGASARSYYNARRYQDAIDQAQVALDLDSTHARARFWVGMAEASRHWISPRSGWAWATRIPPSHC